MKITIIAASIILTTALSGCAGIMPMSNQSQDLPAHSIDQPLHVSYGRVLSVEEGVEMKSKQSGFSLTNIMGSITGANKGTTLIIGMEDTGKVLSITQQTGDKFKVGQRIRLVGTDKKNARVVPADTL